MTRVLELSNSDNWQSVYNTDISAVQVPLSNGKYLHTPISPIVAPILFEKFVLAVSVQTDVPEDSVWKFAGYVRQKISTGLVVGGNQDATLINSKAIFLNQINLILFDKISASYSVEVKVPDWFTRAIVNIWEYIGVDDESSEISTAQEFANINFKLTQIQSSLT